MFLKAQWMRRRRLRRSSASDKGVWRSWSANNGRTYRSKDNLWLWSQKNNFCDHDSKMCIRIQPKQNLKIGVTLQWTCHLKTSLAEHKLRRETLDRKFPFMSCSWWEDLSIKHPVHQNGQELLLGNTDVSLSNKGLNDKKHPATNVFIRCILSQTHPGIQRLDLILHMSI